jgi:hypothetical protein
VATEKICLPLQVPKKATLSKYGLCLAEWQALADSQGGVCYVCEKLTTTGRLCIDHEHVKDWKKLLPEHRKLFVRGLLCYRCNTTFVGRGVTIQRAERVAAYLRLYASRRPIEIPRPPKKGKRNE